MSGALHPLLQRQLAHAGVPRNHLSLPPSVIALLDAVSKTYGRVQTSLDEGVNLSSKLLPILRTDVAGRVVEWNDQLAELTGIASRDVLGEPLISHVHPTAHPRVQRMLLRALQGHVESGVHVPMSGRRGWSHVLSLGASCHYNVSGEVVGVLAVAQILQASDPPPVAPPPVVRKGEPPPKTDGAAESVLDSAGVALVATDAQGRVSHWNRRLEALSGYACAEVLGQIVWQLPPFRASADGLAGGGGGRGKTLSALLERARKGEEALGADVPLRTKRGAGVLLQVSASPVEGGGVVLVGVEVSAQRALEEQKLSAARPLAGEARPGRASGTAASHRAPPGHRKAWGAPEPPHAARGAEGASGGAATPAEGPRSDRGGCTLHVGRKQREDALVEAAEDTSTPLRPCPPFFSSPFAHRQDTRPRIWP